VSLHTRNSEPNKQQQQIKAGLTQYNAYKSINSIQGREKEEYIIVKYVFGS
jgi:hypothetical protein